MPPPNITGILHIGHATFLSIQDALTRYYRKSGYDTLWLPGTDHAGLATHDKIIQSFKKYTPDKETYWKRGLELKEKHHAAITNQIKRTGASCDWDREQYTLNDNFKNAALTALQQINQNGLLYQKEGQWYIDMSHMAKGLLEHIKTGGLIINDTGELHSLIHMLENIEDWCISRQIPWGYQMPLFYDTNNNYCICSSLEEAQTILNSNNITQEESTFDTWFTSSLWPFASLGWPNNTEDYNNYYPAQIIETGGDILFFWCARMLMMGKYLTGIYPFKEIYLHGICRDKEGKKMSKSLGNGIDPIDIINKYGTDALRFGLLAKSNSKDMKIDESEFLDSSKFINKIWQSCRFLDTHIKNHSIEMKMNQNGSFEKEIDEIKSLFIKGMEKRDFLNTLRSIQHSFKHEFCDIWIEKNKKLFWSGDIETIQHGLYIIYSYLNILHCFIPFITTYIGEYFFNLDFISTEY